MRALFHKRKSPFTRRYMKHVLRPVPISTAMLPMVFRQTSCLQEARLGYSVLSRICEGYLASSTQSGSHDKGMDPQQWVKQKQMMLQYVQLCCIEITSNLESSHERMERVRNFQAPWPCLVVYDAYH